jgi:hypothetical protein
MRHYQAVMRRYQAVMRHYQAVMRHYQAVMRRYQAVIFCFHMENSFIVPKGFDAVALAECAPGRKNKNIYFVLLPACTTFVIINF